MHSLAVAIWSKMLTELQQIGGDVVERRSVRQSQKANSDGRLRMAVKWPWLFAVSPRALVFVNIPQ
jgi:hypothetical protein